MDTEIPPPDDYTGSQPQKRSCLRTCLIILGVITAISCVGTLIAGLMFGAAVNQLVAQIQSGDLSGLEGVTIITSEDDDFSSQASDGMATAVADAATMVAANPDDPAVVATATQIAQELATTTAELDARQAETTDAQASTPPDSPPVTDPAAPEPIPTVVPDRPEPVTPPKPDPQSQPLGVIGNGGNLRSAPALDPQNVLAQVCPGDQVAIIGEQGDANMRWLQVRITETAADCVAERAAVGAEGWLAETLVANVITPDAPAANAPPPPVADPAPAAPAQEVQQASVINGGNLRSEPLVAPETVLAQVCPNDTVQVLEQRDTWARVKLVGLGPDCVAERAQLGQEGWLSLSLLGTISTISLNDASAAPETAVPPPAAIPPLLGELGAGLQLGVLPLDGINDFLWSMAFSADTSLLAAGGTDGTLYIWRRDNATPIATIAAHTDWIRAVAFSPDAEFIATGADDQLVRVWRVRDGQLVHTLRGHTDWVRSVAFSPDSRLLASASDDLTVRLWNVGTGELVRVLNGHSDWVRSVTFSPDGTRLASAADDLTVRLWNVSTGALLHTLTGHTDWILSLAFSPDGVRLASGASDLTVRLWRVADGVALHELTGPTDAIKSLAFSPDGNRLAAASSTSTFWLWNTRTVTLEGTYEAGDQFVSYVQFTPDGSQLLTATDMPDMELLRVWELP